MQVLSIVSENYRQKVAEKLERIINRKFIDRLRHLWHYRIIFRCLEDLYWMCWEEKHGYDESIGEFFFLLWQ